MAVSPLGPTIGIALILTALAYGAYASWQQAVNQRFWDHVKDVRTLSGPDFERHVAETYRRLGYSVNVTKRSGDYGVDVIANKGTERLAIQTKQYSGSVGNDSVQEAHTGKMMYNCTAAAVVCTSTFTSAAQATARVTNVELIDGQAYARLMQQTQPRALRKRLPIPTGAPLVRELALLGAGVLVLFVHSLGPSLVQLNQGSFTPTVDATTAAFTPVPTYTFRPALTSNSKPPIPKTEIAKALPSPKATHHVTSQHPPWWTPPPSNSPAPAPTQTEVSTVTPSPVAQVSSAASSSPTVSQEATAVPTLSASPESTP